MNSRSVCHVITGLETGGAEVALSRLLRIQIREGWRVTVVCIGKIGDVGIRLQEENVRICSLNVRTMGDLARGLLVLRHFIRLERPSVVHGWMYHGNLFALLAAGIYYGAAPRVIWSIHQGLSLMKQEKLGTRLVIWLSARLSRRVNVITYVSRESMLQHQRIGFAAVRSVYLPNGFDTVSFRSDTRLRHDARSRLGISASEIVILNLARFHPVKDHETLLGAARRVVAELPHVRFVLAGDGVTEDNPLLGEMVGSLGLQHAVTLHGKCSQPIELLNAADLFCLSSRSEGFPLVIGEAMACELPCVATATGETPHIIGETGLLVSPGDTSALANALLQAASWSPGERRQRGKMARARIIAEFELNSVAEQITTLYTRESFEVG